MMRARAGRQACRRADGALARRVQVRAACDEAADHAHAGCGRAPRLVLENDAALPVAMLACYPGGGAQVCRWRRAAPTSACEQHRGGGSESAGVESALVRG